MNPFISQTKIISSTWNHSVIIKHQVHGDIRYEVKTILYTADGNQSVDIVKLHQKPLTTSEKKEIKRTILNAFKLV